MLRRKSRRLRVRLLSCALALFLASPATAIQTCPIAGTWQLPTCSADLQPRLAAEPEPYLPPPAAAAAGLAAAAMPVAKQPGEWESPITSELITSAVRS